MVLLFVELQQQMSTGLERESRAAPDESPRLIEGRAASRCLEQLVVACLKHADARVVDGRCRRRGECCDGGWRGECGGGRAGGGRGGPRRDSEERGGPRPAGGGRSLVEVLVENWIKLRCFSGERCAARGQRR